MSRRTWIFITLAIIGGLVVVGVLSRRKKLAEEEKRAAEQRARAIPVAATQVAARDVPIYLDGLGTVIAFKTVTVRSQVDGRLDSVFFKEGQPVKRGEQLAQIDPRPFQVQLHQAEGALTRDTSLQHDAKVNLERYTTLRAQNLVSQQQVDDQRATVGQYDGSIAIDRAAVESAKLNLDYARILSPIDGVTGVRLVDQGNLVHASDANGLVVITQLDPIAVLFTLPQDELVRVAEQLRAGVLTVEAYARNGETLLGTGKLTVIDNQINPTTSTIRLKAVFDNPKRLFWPNQFVKARLLLTVRKNALVVPTTAVQHGPKGTFVYIVDNEQKANIRPIEVELIEGQIAIIRKGLELGETVVTDGQSQLRPGGKVSIRRPENASAPDGKANGAH